MKEKILLYIYALFIEKQLEKKKFYFVTENDKNNKLNFDDIKIFLYVKEYKNSEQEHYIILLNEEVNNLLENNKKKKEIVPNLLKDKKFEELKNPENLLRTLLYCTKESKPILYIKENSKIKLVSDDYINTLSTYFILKFIN